MKTWQLQKRILLVIFCCSLFIRFRRKNLKFLHLMQLRAFKMWLSIVMNSKSFYMWYPSHILKKLFPGILSRGSCSSMFGKTCWSFGSFFTRFEILILITYLSKNIFSKIKILGLAQDPKSLQLLAGLVEAAMKSPLKGKLKA